MAEEQANNVAPAEAQDALSTSVATPNTENTNTEAKAPEQAPESVSPYLDKMSEADRKDLDRFLANNGGMKAFNKWKESISNPQKKTEEKQAPAQAPETKQPEQETKTQPKPSKGSITPGEFLTRQYFNGLADEEQYRPIADEIRSGEIFNDMAKLDISPLDANGYLNDEKVRFFLDLKVKTVPPKAPKTEPTSTTPTVDFVDVGEKITSHEDAEKVLAQADHPKHKEALRFIANEINNS